MVLFQSFENINDWKGRLNNNFFYEIISTKMRKDNKMKKEIMKNTIVMALAIILSINLTYKEPFSSKTVLAKTQPKEIVYENDTLKELQEAIDEANEDGKITQTEQLGLVCNTAPEIRNQYMKNEVQRALDSELEFDIKVGESGKIKKDIGNGTTIEFGYTDEEENDTLDKVVDSILNVFSQDVYARSSSNTVTKKYGARMCSDYFRVICGVGAATLYLDNHYTLSKNGIKERYGESSASAVGFVGTVEAQDPYITDSVATKPGKSDTNLKCRYDFLLSGLYVFNIQYTNYIESILHYDSINKSKGEITLTQKFKLID